MNHKYVVTIGRSLGSGGRIIGEQLAKQLGISFYDKELILRASKETGLARSCFEQADEDFNPMLSGGLFQNFFQDVSFSSETLFRLQSDVMQDIAKQESAVIVGRCADYVLRAHPLCLNVFVTAHLDDRIRRVMEYRGVSADKARALIEKVDKKRTSFYNYFSNKQWGSAHSYDLCINSSVLGIEKTTELILTVAKEKFAL